MLLAPRASARGYRWIAAPRLRRAIGATLLKGRMEAGIHSVDFRATGLPTGSYLYRLESEFGTRTRKMLVVK